MAYPLLHPRSRRQVPLVMTEEEFSEAFPEEDGFVEFKTGTSRKALQRTVTAFSNTDGGVIFIGVDNAGHVLGRALTAGVENDVTGAILEVHDPGRYWIHELAVGTRAVTVVSVARRSQGFAQTPDGIVLARRGARSVPLVGAEMLQFVTSKALARFDTTSSGAPLSKASSDLLEELRLAFGWRNPAALEERLRNERLVAGDGVPNLTIAGALTLLDDPSEQLGKSYVEILRYAGEGVDYDRRQEIRGPVQAQVAEATRFVMEELGTDLVVTGVRRRELPKLPEVVVREAVANAVAHRSYEEAGRAVRIELRPDRVVIESPGGFPEPVTEENIRETASARNISVIRVLRTLRLAEDSGRGVDVMYDQMAEALLDPPQFHDLDHSVRVTLPVRGAISPQERAWVLEVERRGGIAPRDRLLLVYAARGEALTNERGRELLGVDSRDARWALKRLTQQGLLRQVGQRGGAHYVLAAGIGAPPAFRLTPADLRQLILKLAEAGPITNASVREVTGLDRAEALRLLDSLVAAGRLVRRGERRGAHYVRP